MGSWILGKGAGLTLRGRRSLTWQGKKASLLGEGESSNYKGADEPRYSG